MIYLVRGTFLITQALRPYIPSHDNARIIVVSSVSARINSRGRGFIVVSALMSR
jgi:NAD(P)-dependent dehydrogenase (short-subunit alcohol dehydrogenase family)